MRDSPPAADPQPIPTSGSKTPPRPRPPSRQETTGGSRNVYQPVADCVYHQLGSFVNVQRLHDVCPVYGDSISAQLKLVGDLLVRLPFHDQLQNLEFAPGECGSALAFESRRALEHG